MTRDEQGNPPFILYWGKKTHKMNMQPKACASYYDSGMNTDNTMHLWLFYSLYAFSH